jgi:hypothetical protein
VCNEDAETFRAQLVNSPGRLKKYIYEVTTGKRRRYNLRGL